jgi:DNA-binding transcriptional LysR family regulator
MVPTEKGKVFYNFIIEALSKLEDAEKNFQRSTEIHTPTISVGMCFETFQITLEPYVSTLPFNLIIQFGEYPEMLENLDKGILDLIITPQTGTTTNIEHEAFSSERIVLMAGMDTNEEEFDQLVKAGDINLVLDWLKAHKWYGTTGDMEHLRRFWQLNFNRYPDFRPNYIVPNLNSIVRCLSGGTGLAVIPNHLGKKEIENEQVKVLWEGYNLLENTLYFASRHKAMHSEEIQTIKNLIRKVM